MAVQISADVITSKLLDDWIYSETSGPLLFTAEGLRRCSDKFVFCGELHLERDRFRR